MSNSFIWPIDRTLSSATTQGQSQLGSKNNEGVLHISQSSRITVASPSVCLVSYPGKLIRGLLLCRDAVGVFYSPNCLDSGPWGLCNSLLEIVRPIAAKLPMKKVIHLWILVRIDKDTHDYSLSPWGVISKSFSSAPLHMLLLWINMCV